MKFTSNHQNWQQRLIETNLLIIGFNAWNGYLKAGRGAVVCTTNSPLLDNFGETFKTHFVSRPRLAAFLNTWLAAPDTVILQGHFINSHILEAVDRYNPETDLVLLLESDDHANFIYLRNLPITPHQCYQQVYQEWAEFQPQFTLAIAQTKNRD
jgi:hypothetical protein